MGQIERTVSVDGDVVVVAYPRTMKGSSAWRHLLTHPPAETVRHRRTAHVVTRNNPWVRCHTRDSWRWRTRLRNPAALEERKEAHGQA